MTKRTSISFQQPLCAFMFCLMANLGHANDDQQLLSLKVSAYTNAEVAVQQINELKGNTANQDEQQQWLWLRLAEAQGLLLEFNTMEQSLNAVEKHIFQTNDPSAKAQYLLLKGILAQHNGALSEAKDFLNLAIEQSKVSQQKSLELHARAELAYTYILEEQYQQALSINHQVLLEALEQNDTFISALAEDVNGAIYGYMDQYEESIEHYQKALERYNKLNYTQYTSSAIFGIATSYRYWGKLNQALKYFDRYEQVLSYTTSESSKFYGRYGKATTLAAMHDFDRALPAINKALATEGPKDYKAELYKLQASSYIHQKNLTAAKISLSHAEELFKQLPDLQDTNWDIETIKISADIEQASNNHDLAFDLLSEYHNRKSVIDAGVYSEKLMAYKANQENQRKDLEIKLLTENAKVQELTTHNQTRENKLQRFVLIGLTAAIISILIFVVIQYRNLKRISELSIRDELTGLFNRRHIFYYLNEILADNNGDKRFSVIIADIDNFKQINDQYGHPAGDCIIKGIAEISLETLRMTDIVGRIGGEEYLFILPRTSPEQGEEVVDRLLKTVRNKQFLLPSGKEIQVTISMGICHNNSHITSVNALIQKADEALYISKENGKDSCTTATHI